MPNLPQLTERLLAKERVFKAPPFNAKMVDALSLIAPQFEFEPSEECRDYWEANQNAACWGEYEALKGIFAELPKPRRVLEIGPGMGRSVVFFSKMLNWHDVTFDLYEGNGSEGSYGLLRERSETTFYGCIPLLKECLAYNEQSNYRVFDAQDLECRLDRLPGGYDYIYSFYSVGWHWSLEHFLDELASVMGDSTLAVFTIPDRFEPFEKLQFFYWSVIEWEAAWPANRKLRLLLLSKSNVLQIPDPSRSAL